MGSFVEARWEGRDRRTDNEDSIYRYQWGRVVGGEKGGRWVRKAERIIQGSGDDMQDGRIAGNVPGQGKG